jgi:hypothetical protein
MLVERYALATGLSEESLRHCRRIGVAIGWAEAGAVQIIRQQSQPRPARDHLGRRQQLAGYAKPLL